jgi:SAM-dependent methyltransferase
MTVAVDRCPLCCGTTFEPFERQTDDGRELTYILCSTCGMVIQSPRMSEEDLAEFYAAGYRLAVQGTEGATEKDLRMQAGRARHLVEFCRGIVPTVSRHLDIGSSSGALLRAFGRKYGSTGVGVEPGAAYREIARKRGTRTVSALEELERPSQGSFDLVSIIHVLEHLPDPVGYLRRLRETWMAPNGRLLVEVPHLFGHRGTELSHLWVFSPRTLRQTLELAGFRVLKVRTHGVPRSPALRLYLTAVAQALPAHASGGQPHFTSRWTRTRRRLGLWFYDALTKRLPNWTWKEWPAPEEGGN